MYTIFINDSVIYLAERGLNSKDITSIEYENINFSEVIDSFLLNNNNGKICYYHSNLAFLWKSFQSHFKLIKAAGGLVFNEKNETLWIYRHDKWDLPKGKIEAGERIDETAVREVQEECGLHDVQLGESLLETYHIYKHKEIMVLKTSYWFKMYASAEEQLKPQLEEGITKAVWIKNVKLKAVLKNTYGNIKLLSESSI